MRRAALRLAALAVLSRWPGFVAYHGRTACSANMGLCRLVGIVGRDRFAHTVR
jgi:hypothetical protein